MFGKNFYITTPIYYVNDVPHIGHAYTTIICDVIARFMKLDGYNVRFITGTDEHGQKVEKAARGKFEDISNKELNVFDISQRFVDETSLVFRRLLKVMNCEADDFIRTTEKRHKKAVINLWQRLVDNGQIYSSSYSGWYSIRDETFYQEKELVNGKAPTGASVEWVKEPSYFFRLANWQEKLLSFYKEHQNFITPVNRFNEIISFVQSGLKDLSISRTSFSWGIAVPNDKSHIIYVWIDALTNYLTALNFPDLKNDLYQTYWNNADGMVVHVLGKDILRFHAVYWPAILMAAGLPLPKKILAHGWWTNEGQKISKSLGNVIDPFDLIEEFRVDYLRYFLVREIPIGNDGSFSRERFIECVNAELVNNIGNLVQRTLSMVYKEYDGAVPKVCMDLFTGEDTLPNYHEILDNARSHMIKYEIREYIFIILNLSTSANEYINRKAPWKLVKIDKELTKVVLYKALEYIKCIGLLLQPIVPESASILLNQLAVPPNERTTLEFFSVPVNMGKALPKPEHIFPRIVV